MAAFLSFDQAAAGTDAGLTSHHAVVTVGGAAPGVTVGIIGLGGLGLTGARIAVLKGAEVYAAEINAETRQLGLDRGVRQVVADAAELAQFSPDVIIDFAGFGTTTAAAVEAVRPGGRVVQVGLGRGESTISTNTLVSHQVQLFGSLGGLKADAEGVFELLGTGELRIMTTVVPFSEIGDGIDRLRDGTVRGRLVADVTTA